MLIKFSGKPSQFKLLAEFFSNISVAWFVAAFISPDDLLIVLRSLVNMIMFLFISLLLLEKANGS